MKYKVGDMVRVRKDLVVNNEYNGVIYISSMDEFKDKECVITNIDDLAYQLNNSDRWWSEEMLEPVDDLLEYALEKLGMTKEELEDEMNIDEEDMEKAKEIVRLNNETDTYCKLFDADCKGCKIEKLGMKL